MNLQTIIAQLQSQPTGLAFDIDDTLSSTSDGYFDLLNLTHPAPTYLTKELFRKKYARTGEVTHWRSIQDAYDLLISKVNCPQFHYELSPFPHAIEQTTILNNHNFFACYLTARKEDMRELTQRWLDEQGFPKKPLIMRDNTIEFSNHTQWKTAALHSLYPYIQGLIDNDARILSHLQQRSYPGNLYLFGLSPHEYNGNGTITVRETWREMSEIILGKQQR